jgi:hypothetical protein
MQPPLYDLLGPLAMTKAEDEILAGTFIPPEGTDPFVVKLLPHLKRVPGAQDKKPPTFTKEIHCEGWKKQKERTSSGPSGWHFGHSKAGALNAVIANFEYKMAAIPYRTGFSPLGWQHGTDVMLEKKKGTFNVEKLRAILLYEANFNQQTDWTTDDVYGRRTRGDRKGAIGKSKESFGN